MQKKTNKKNSCEIYCLLIRSFSAFLASKDSSLAINGCYFEF